MLSEEVSGHVKRIGRQSDLRTSAIGTAVVSTIKTNKLVEALPARVAPVALQAGLPASSLPLLIQFLFISPALLVEVPGITPQVVGAVLPAYYDAQAYAFSFAWYVIVDVCHSLF